MLLRAAETISHIRMQKLIERDVGDEEREQRQLFVTSFYLTGIIRYMKLKFLTRGSCWQHYFLFRSSPFFFCVSVYANLDPVFFPWSLKTRHPALKMVFQFHSLHTEEQLISWFKPLSWFQLFWLESIACTHVYVSLYGSSLRVVHVCAFTAVQPWLCCEFLRHVNHPHSITEEHLIKEHCGLGGIMGYVTFRHKTRRGPLVVPCSHEKQLLSCFSQLKSTKWHISKHWHSLLNTFTLECLRM